MANLNDSLNASQLEKYQDRQKRRQTKQGTIEQDHTVKQTRIFDDNVILIKPQFDASDKEIYAKNGYRTAAKNLVNFLESGNRQKFAENVFKPKYLGDFTNNCEGVVKKVVPNTNKPDFRMKNTKK